MRAVIDISGLPGVAQYYRMFPREPSLNRALDMRITRRVEIRQIDFEKVLDAILALPQDENEILIVGHGMPQGFYMKLTAGSGIPTSQPNLQLLARAGAALDEAAAIRRAGLAVEAQVARWTRLLRQLPVVVEGDITVEQGENTLERWLAGLARSIGVTVARLRSFLDKVKRVRQQRLSRVEVRACNMGRDLAALETMRGFLGARQIIAPRVTFFYVTVVPQVIPDPQRFEQWVRANGGPVGGGVYAGRVGPANRAFDVAVPAMLGRGRQRAFVNAPVGFMIEGGFVLRIWETSLHPHRFASRAAALSWTCVDRWVSWNVMPGSTYRGRGSFYLLGFWTFGEGGHPYVVPEEQEYRDQLESVVAPAAAGR